MKSNAALYPPIILVLLAILACDISASTPQADPNAFNTMVAQTASVQLTQAAPVNPPGLPPTTQPSPIANPTQPSSQDVYAPDPLGPAWSGMWFANDTCYDLDVLFTANDASCDVSLDATTQTMLVPKNQAVFGFYVSQTPPSLGQCQAASMNANESGPLLTDYYICFKTNAGKYGFFVARQINSSGITFDAYVFP